MNQLLADIELPPGTRWINRHEYSPVRLSAERTISGGMAYSAQRLIGGRPIILEFKKTDFPLLSIAQIEKLKTYASIPNQTLLMVWNNVEYVVIFDHTRSPFEFEPLIGLKNETQDFFAGKLYLLEV